MSAYTGKPCAMCGGRKGKKYINLKFCGNCVHRKKKERSLNAHGKALEKRYGITSETYWELYAYQDGRCYICRWATGKSRRLTVDHDHKTGLVRGLLCRPCNTFLGVIRDCIEAAERVVAYLKDPPYQRMLRGIVKDKD
jgi:hypothetical protein